jgi:hypothetical protein
MGHLLEKNSTVMEHKKKERIYFDFPKEGLFE